MPPKIVQELLKDRHALDAIARAIVSGERGRGDVADTIADDVASLMINRLDAAGVPGHQRVAHLRWDDPEHRPRVEQQYGRELLDVLIQRTGKLLAHAAMMHFTRGESLLHWSLPTHLIRASNVNEDRYRPSAPRPPPSARTPS